MYMMILVQDVTGVVAFPSSSQTLSRSSLQILNMQLYASFSTPFHFQYSITRLFSSTLFFQQITLAEFFLLNPSFQLTKWIQPQTFLLYISMVKGTLSTYVYPLTTYLL